MKVKVSELLSMCETVLQGAGMDKEEAKIFAKILVKTDQRGVKSHGVMALGRYVSLLERGIMPKKAQYMVVEENDVMAVWDGNRSCGQVMGYYGMTEAIKKAREKGIGLVGIRNSSHFGAGATYSLLAEQEGMIGITISTGAPVMSAYGGAGKAVGTNPLAISVPTEKELPLTLDMACSVVAMGKIDNMRTQGIKEIPAGWALDANGDPTVKTDEVFAVAPVGGYKGFGLSLMVEMLAAGLLGGGMGEQARDDDMGPSYMFMALDPKKFGQGEAFTSRVDQRIRELKNGKRCTNSQGIFMPGELEELTNQKSQENVEVIDEIIEQVNQIGEKYHCGFAIKAVAE